MDRLPAMAGDLVRRQVTVIAATFYSGCGCSQSGNHDGSHRIHHRGRSDQLGSCRKLEPARRERDWREQFDQRVS